MINQKGVPVRRSTPKAQRSALRLGAGSIATLLLQQRGRILLDRIAAFSSFDHVNSRRGPATLPDLYHSFTHARQGSGV